MGQKTIILPFLLVSCQFISGCQHPSYFSRNEASGREIVIAANAYTLDASAKFPDSLNDLVASGLLKFVPQCQCEDGKLRDFIYVPGFTIADSSDYIILATPPEMARNYAIIFQINNTAHIVEKDKARTALEISYEHLRNRLRGQHN